MPLYGPDIYWEIQRQEVRSPDALACASTDMCDLVTNTDDFLIRMLKGCIQLSSRPHITNTVNMVPVDHVARVVIASALHPPQSSLAVVQVTSHPRLRFEQYLSSLEFYGYRVPEVDYTSWRTSLENYVSDGGLQRDYIQHAL